MNEVPPAAAPGDFGFVHFFGQADAMAQFVLLVLVLMSVFSWYVILARVVEEWGRRRRSRDYMAAHADAAPGAAASAAEPFGRLALAAARSWARHGLAAGARDAALAAPPELLAKALRRALIAETARRERGLTVLASVAASAPFVGLFGTVWGIYHALLAIGASGRAGLDQVAGPVGEALVMTAIGLSVAIPAVLAYNAFQRGNRALLAELDGYAHELYERLAGGAGRESRP